MSILPHWLFSSSSLFETYWLFLNFSFRKLLPLWLNTLIYSPYNVCTLLLPVIYGICGLLLFNSINYFGIKFYESRYTPTWPMKSACAVDSSSSWKHTHTYVFRHSQKQSLKYFHLRLRHCCISIEISSYSENHLTHPKKLLNFSKPPQCK